MRVQSEVRAGLYGLLALQLASALICIVVLLRMSPAIEDILQENVYSLEAVETMALELARDAGQGRTEAFDKALERANANVTEDAEVPILARIEDASDRAFVAGDVAARNQLADDLRALATVNRASMDRADAEAKRLSVTGAWAASILGTIAMLLAVLAYRRLTSRLELPLLELARTLRMARAGNRQVRASPIPAPVELERLSTDVNWLLDEHLSGRDGAPEVESVEADALRLLIVALLDGRSSPSVVMRGADSVVATSKDAIGARPDDEWSAHPIDGTDLTLWTASGPIDTGVANG